MLEWLRDISDWLLDLADSPWGPVALAVGAFFESIIFPIPPDPLLIAIAVPNPGMALWLAALVTVASVAGAFGGHWLGKRIGRPLADRLFSEAKVATVERMFQRYGTWAVLVAAFSPIPYKVFAITAGVLDLDRRRFLIASVIGRGARFFLIGALAMVFGEKIEQFFDDNFDTVMWVVAAGVVAALAAYLVLHRWRRTRSAPSGT